jgi:hypothetical protein
MENIVLPLLADLKPNEDNYAALAEAAVGYGADTLWITQIHPLLLT